MDRNHVLEQYFSACSTGDLAFLKKLNLDKSQKSAKTTGGLQAIHLASIAGHVEIAQYLVNDGAQINSRDDKGMSPLHHACQHGNLEFVKWLLSQKIFKNNRNSDGLSPLLCAASNGHLEVVKLLISENVFDFIVDNDGNSALHLAYLRGHTTVALWLVQNGMDVNLKNNYGKTPLELVDDDGTQSHHQNIETSTQIESIKVKNSKSDGELKELVQTSDKITTTLLKLDQTTNIQTGDVHTKDLSTPHSFIAESPNKSGTIDAKKEAVITIIKVRLASDSKRDGIISLPYNSSWDDITNNIASVIKITASWIQRLVLTNKTGETISPTISNSQMFWEVVANSYDIDDGMAFEVFLGARQNKPVVVTAVKEARLRALLQAKAELENKGTEGNKLISETVVPVEQGLTVTVAEPIEASPRLEVPPLPPVYTSRVTELPPSPSPPSLPSSHSYSPSSFSRAGHRTEIKSPSPETTTTTSNSNSSSLSTSTSFSQIISNYNIVDANIPTVRTIKMKLSSNKTRSAFIRVHDTFSWRILTDAISTALELPPNKLVRHLLLTNEFGEICSGTISSMARFNKVCSDDYDVKRGMVFEVFCEEDKEDIDDDDVDGLRGMPPPSTSASRSYITPHIASLVAPLSPALAALVSKSGDISNGNHTSNTTLTTSNITTITATTKSVDIAIERVLPKPFPMPEQLFQESSIPSPKLTESTPLPPSTTDIVSINKLPIMPTSTTIMPSIATAPVTTTTTIPVPNTITSPTLTENKTFPLQSVPPPPPPLLLPTEIIAQQQQQQQKHQQQESKPDIISSSNDSFVSLRLRLSVAGSTLTQLLRIDAETLSWESLIADITQQFSIAVLEYSIKGLLLFDSEGDQISTIITTYNAFRRAVLNIYEEEEDMLFEIILNEKVNPPVSPSDFLPPQESKPYFAHSSILSDNNNNNDVSKYQSYGNIPAVQTNISPTLPEDDRSSIMAVNKERENEVPRKDINDKMAILDNDSSKKDDNGNGNRVATAAEVSTFSISNESSEGSYNNNTNINNNNNSNNSNNNSGNNSNNNSGNNNGNNDAINFTISSTGSFEGSNYSGTSQYSSIYSDITLLETSKLAKSASTPPRSHALFTARKFLESINVIPPSSDTTSSEGCSISGHTDETVSNSTTTTTTTTSNLDDTTPSPSNTAAPTPSASKVTAAASVSITVWHPIDPGRSVPMEVSEEATWQSLSHNLCHQLGLSVDNNKPEGFIAALIDLHSPTQLTTVPDIISFCCRNDSNVMSEPQHHHRTELRVVLKQAPSLRIKLRLQSDRSSILHLTIPIDCSWETLSSIITSAFNAQHAITAASTALETIVLFDDEGDAVSPAVSSANNFWKVIKNIYDEEEYMIFEAKLKKVDLSTTPLTPEIVNAAANAAAPHPPSTLTTHQQQQHQPQQALIKSDPTIKILKMRLSMDPDNSQNIRVPFESTWEVVRILISTAFDINQELFTISSIALHDDEGDIISPAITTSTSLWKVFTNMYDEEENMTFEVMLASKNEKIIIGSVESPPQLAPLPLSSEHFSSLSTIDSNFRVDNINIHNDNITDNNYSIMSITKKCVMRIRWNYRPEHIIQVVIPKQTTWEALLAHIQSALSLPPDKTIIRLILRNEIDDAVVHSKIQEINTLLELYTHNYDFERLMIYEVMLVDTPTNIDNSSHYSSTQPTYNINTTAAAEGISPSLAPPTATSPFIRYQELHNYILQYPTLSERESEARSQTHRGDVGGGDCPPFAAEEAVQGGLRRSSAEQRVRTALDRAREAMRERKQMVGERHSAPVLVHDGDDDDEDSGAAAAVAATGGVHSKGNKLADPSSRSTGISQSPSRTSTSTSGDKIEDVKICLACYPSHQITVKVPTECAWEKLSAIIATSLKLSSGKEVEGLVLTDAEKDQISPAIKLGPVFWKVFKRTYRADKGMIFYVLVSPDLANRILADILCGVSALIAAKMDPSPPSPTAAASSLPDTTSSGGTSSLGKKIKIKLYSDSTKIVDIFIPEEITWDSLSEAIRQGLSLASNTVIERVMLVDGEGDQVSPAMKNIDRFQKVLDNSYDPEEGMLFEVFVSETSPEKTTAKTTSTGGSPNRISLPKKIYVPIRFSLTDGSDRSADILVLTDCSWIKLAQAIADHLGPMQASWIQRLLLVNTEGIALSKYVEDGASFWKLYYSLESPSSAIFEVYQSLVAAPPGQLNAGSVLTTNSGALLAGPDIKSLDHKGMRAIHLASVSNNLQLLCWLLKAGCDVNTADCHGMTALHYACDGQSMELIDILLRLGANCLVPNAFGLTPLHFICLRGLVSLLPLIKPEYVNLSNNCNLTLLHCACDEGYIDIVNYLLENEAYVDVRDGDGMTPLHYACLHGHRAVAELLIEFGAYVNTRDDEGMSAFLYACAEGHLETAQWLVVMGASLQARNDAGDNALHLASEDGDLKLVNWLIVKGVDFNSRDQDGWTPLHYASKGGNVEVAVLLEGAGSSIWVDAHEKLEILIKADKSTEVVLRAQEMKDEAQLVELRQNQVEPPIYPPHKIFVESELNEALRNACTRGQEEEVLSLIVCGASVISRNANGSTPLHFACAAGQLHVAKKLVDAGAEINAFNVTGSTPLHFASDKGHVSLILWLVSQGADPSVRNKDLFSPLHFLCTRGMAEVLEEITGTLNVPIDPNQVGKKNISLIHCSSEQGHANVVKVLVTLGGLVNYMDYDCKTALHYASIRGHALTVKCLLEHGAAINTKDNSGNTPLAYACAGGYVELAKKLESYGADKNSRNRLGNTCLHSACLLGKLELAQWLAESGAKLWTKNRNGDTPYDIAVRGKQHEIVNWFNSTFPDIPGLKMRVY